MSLSFSTTGGAAIATDQDALETPLKGTPGNSRAILVHLPHTLLKLAVSRVPVIRQKIQIGAQVRLLDVLCVQPRPAAGWQLG